MRRNAFTLVELLVAMTIAAVVFGVVGTRMNRTLPKARDDRRKTDLNSVKLILEGYYFAQSPRACPDPGASTPEDNYQALKPLLRSEGYAGDLPDDPLFPKQGYGYEVFEDGKCYQLTAQAEVGGGIIGVCGGGYQCMLENCTAPGFTALPTLTPAPTQPPTPTPTSTLTPTLAPTPNPTVSPTLTPTLTPSPTPTLSPTPTMTPTPTLTPTPTPEPTDCEAYCQSLGYAGGTCSFLLCWLGGTSVGQDGCPAYFVCCCE